MKKIFIIAPSLSYGGLEISLINLLNNIDYTKYKVDLYLFQEGLDLLSKLNSKVKVLEKTNEYINFFGKSLFKSVFHFLKKGKINIAIYRFLWGIEPSIYKLIKKKYSRKSKFDWFCIKKVLPKFDNKYDIGISYSEGHSNYYIIDCINADKKIGWYHTDYNMTDPNIDLDKKYFTKLDYLNTVSNASKEAILNHIPEIKDKVNVISNILDTDRIDKLKKEIPNEFINNNSVKIVSVGRLVKLKGFDICIKTIKILVDNGFDIKLYIIGDGEERENLTSLIKNLQLQENVFLLGMKENPYSYINHSDICIQMSELEGRSCVIEEEKYLCKPIIVSDIPSFNEQITHKKNGIIVERNCNDLATSIESFLADNTLKENMINNLKNEKQNNDTISLLYKEFEDN